MGGNDLNQPVEDQFLGAMGLSGLNDDDKQKALGDILYSLNIRIGKRVISTLTDDQADEFDKLMDSEEEPAMAKWLKDNVLNYEQLVTEEADAMRDQAADLTNKVMNQRKAS